MAYFAPSGSCSSSSSSDVFNDNTHIIRQLAIVPDTSLLVILDPAVLSIENDNPARYMEMSAGATVTYA